MDNFKVGFILLVVLGAIFNFFIGFGDNSTGIRTGELIKFSYKGWIWQTYEGELSMQTLSEYGAYVYEFSVCDKSPQKVRVLENNIGKIVTIKYTSPIIFFKWNQKSKYCVEEIYVVGEKVV